MSACAADVQTITLPPRIEKQRLSIDLVTPCPVSPAPAAATPKAVALWLPQVVHERDCNAWKLEQIGRQVETVP